MRSQKFDAEKATGSQCLVAVDGSSMRTSATELRKTVSNCCASIRITAFNETSAIEGEAKRETVVTADRRGSEFHYVKQPFREHNCVAAARPSQPAYHARRRSPPRLSMRAMVSLAKIS